MHIPRQRVGTRKALRAKDKRWLLIALIGALVLAALGIKTFTGSPPADLGIEQGTENYKEVLVTRVIDGDTIEIEGGERVRYLGIDTPETVDPRRPVQCFGAEASIENKALVEGKYVRLHKDITDRDKYGRLLRYVYVDDKFVNLELVKSGFAHIFTLAPDVKYAEEFLKAEREAREARRGLWGACFSGFLE